MAEYIDKGELIQYCRKCADLAHMLWEKALNSMDEQGRCSDFAAIAFFQQKESMYRHEIPGIIESFCEEIGSYKTGKEG